MSCMVYHRLNLWKFFADFDWLYLTLGRPYPLQSDYIPSISSSWLQSASVGVTDSESVINTDLQLAALAAMERMLIFHNDIKINDPS